MPWLTVVEGSIDGKVRGKLDIAPEQMTDEIWEYIFVDGPCPANAPLPREKADAMKHEYEYFYPFDVRSSGKDLINNHLSFAVYNHAAIFPESKWPLSMRANGHILLNGQKMSKSKGNSLTLRQAVEKFGADATRLALADSGDGIEDANFEEKNANANILRIHTLLMWCEVSLRAWTFVIFLIICPRKCCRRAQACARDRKTRTMTRSLKRKSTT
jgi:leucyl-tRNA synthetase